MMMINGINMAVVSRAKCQYYFFLIFSNTENRDEARIFQMLPEFVCFRLFPNNTSTLRCQ